MTTTTHSPLETQQHAETFSRTLTGGDIVLLHGDLGAGKTTWVKGLAKGLGIEETIVSPTFTLMSVYPIQAKKNALQTLVHIDTYRLDNEQQLVDIGVEDYLGAPDTVCVIEWPEKLSSLLKNKKTKSVSLETLSPQDRQITVREDTTVSPDASSPVF